jgi:hypothetical protein
MLLFCYAIVIMLIILVLYSWERSTYCVKRGSHCFRVSQEHDEKEKAADIIHRLNSDMESFVAYLGEEYDVDRADDKKQLHKDWVEFLLSNYKTGYLEENIFGGVDDTTYIDNKELIAICLRDPAKNNEIFHDYNTIMFAMLHEISHACVESYGHEADFWQAFAFILKNAVAFGIYNPVNYEVHPVNYCGLYLDYNPMFDSMYST